MRLEWSLSARADLDRIQDYIERDRPIAAERIWARVYDRVARLVDMPFAAPLHGAGLARRLVISGTPYVVFYIVDGDVIKVEQVRHAAQDV